MTTTPIPPNWRGLCEELADSIELLLEMRPTDAKPLSITEERYARARALLAQPEPEVVGPPSDFIDPAPPAEGEVGELVAWLRETGDLIQPSHLAEHQRYKRAADLLERHPAPVPVAERLGYLQAGIKYGYQAGHEDTVEACFGDPSSFAKEMAPEILEEIESGALPLPAGEVQ